MKNRKQGFTLIELVVATLIIGLLAAVLVPNALGARARANGAAVQTFLKNLSQEMEVKYSDAGAYYPVGTLVDGIQEGEEVSYGRQVFIDEFLASAAGASTAGTKDDFEGIFDISIPRDISIVFRTDLPDAHSGYCVVARWNTRDTTNYVSYMLTPDRGIQPLDASQLAAADTCVDFD
jgi:prepilin-type N-terminal cleavage/methylation domain-containing protein